MCLVHRGDFYPFFDQATAVAWSGLAHTARRPAARSGSEADNATWKSRNYCGGGLFDKSGLEHALKKRDNNIGSGRSAL